MLPTLLTLCRGYCHTLSPHLITNFLKGCINVHIDECVSHTLTFYPFINKPHSLASSFVYIEAKVSEKNSQIPQSPNSHKMYGFCQN